MELQGTLADREFLDLRFDLLNRMAQFVEAVLKPLLEGEVFVEQHIWDDQDLDGSVGSRMLGLVADDVLLRMSKKAYFVPSRQPVWLIHLVESTQTPRMLKGPDPLGHRQHYPMPDWGSLPPPGRGYRIWVTTTWEVVDKLSFILHALMVSTENMDRRRSAPGIHEFECDEHTWRLLVGLARAVWLHMGGLTQKRFEEYQPSHVDFFRQHDASYSFNRLVLSWLTRCRTPPHAADPLRKFVRF